MNIGEVIAALIKYASNFGGDDILLCKTVYGIEVKEENENGYEITINFVDGNTSDVVIDKDGHFIRFVS